MSKLVNHVKNSDYKLITNDPESNWDLYVNSEGKALSIAKKKGCESSFFGDVKYIKRLVRLGHFDSELNHLTKYGKRLLTGVQL